MDKKIREVYSKPLFLKLIKFLMSRGLYSNYVRAILRESHASMIDRRLFSFLRRESDAFEIAFTWRRTDEGFDFWDEVDEKWRRYNENKHHGKK